MPPRLARSAAALCAGLQLLAACGTPKVPDAEARLVLADISASAQNATLVTQVDGIVAAQAKDMDGPGVLTVLAFSSEVGSSKCPPLTMTLVWSDNSTEFRDNRETYTKQLQRALPDYFACAAASVKKGGSDVIGALAEAGDLLAKQPGGRSAVLISDGCQNARGIKLCSAKRLTDERWRQKVIADLPAVSKPSSLEGVTITMVGLGAGSNLQQDQVASLRAFYNEYCQAVKAICN